MNNIEKFEFGMTAVLSKLYEEFPVPTVLDIKDLDPEIKNDASDHDQKLLLIHSSTIHFLKSEGYIKTNDKEVKNTIKFRGCVLTSKGFSALQKIPSTMRESKSVIEQIHDVKSKGIATVSKSIVSGIVKAFFAG